MSDWKRNRLRVWRAERRLSQESVAARIRVSQAQYSKFERGAAEPDGKTKRRLARVLRVEVDALTASTEETVSR